jgi:hypothetical protein
LLNKALEALAFVFVSLLSVSLTLDVLDFFKISLFVLSGVENEKVSILALKSD